MTRRTQWILGIAGLSIVGLSFLPTGSKKPRVSSPLPRGMSNPVVTIVRPMESIIPPPKPPSSLSIVSLPSLSKIPEVPVLSVHYSVTEPSEPSPYAPTGRLIACKLVNALETIRIETPIIGLVTRDVWHQGELIVPAGTEMLGRAQVDRSRNRIAGHPAWRLVYQDGRELAFTGILLNRETDPTGAGWGPDDGSAGIKGRVIRSDSYENLVLFLTTAMSGFAQGLQNRQNTPWAGSAPVASLGNAGLSAGSNVMETYARQVWETIQRDGVYVHVDGGSEFYVFATEPLDLAKVTRGGRGNPELPAAKAAR